MQNNRTATNGEISFYNEIRGKKITALVGHSNRGKGWRPVCGGKFLGEEVFENEGAAISGGKRFISDLTQRVINAESKSRNKPIDLNTGIEPTDEEKEEIDNLLFKEAVFQEAVATVLQQQKNTAPTASKRSRKKSGSNKAVNHD